MPMTITEKLLARGAGKPVAPGEMVWVNVNVLLTHDVCGPGAIEAFRREFGAEARVWNRDGTVIIPDHYIFTSDEKARRNIGILRDFAREQELTHFYEPGTPRYRGVCHVALPQEGHVRPGEIIFGTDSHTCTHGALGAFAAGIGHTDAAFVLGTGRLLVRVPETLRFTIDGILPDHVMAKDVILRIIGDIGVDGASYCAMEFRGEAVSAMSVEERMTMCNMTVEAGAKNGIVAPDEKALAYVGERTDRPFEPVHGDSECRVREDREYRATSFEPCVAEPHVPSNYAVARDRSDVKLDRAYIGSCTGGKLTDFLAAGRILSGRRVSIDTFLVPATAEVAEGLAREIVDGRTLLSVLADAGCREVAPPSCAACLGGPADTYGRTEADEVVISTTNRNFVGRMGSKEARIYLASPLTVAASAVTGRITDPRELMS
jgi:3-isopropylmalate/(R)-2-methylmalate dehydratase large subunit